MSILTRRILPLVAFAVIVPNLSAQTDDDKVFALAQRLRDVGDTLKRPETIASEPDKHLDNLRILRELRKELADATDAHGAKMKKSGGQGPYHKLDIAWRYADGQLREYERYAVLFASVEGVQQELDRVIRSAKLGVENKAPAFFKPGNDIQKGLDKARLRLSALEALDPDGKAIASVKKAIDDTAEQVKQMQEGMRAGILAANDPPPDEYRKADREAIIKVLTDKWAKEGTSSEVLKVGIVTAEWNRGVAWQKVGSEWQKSDRSKIQGYVIVKHDDRTAARHSINLVKDHLAEDKVTASFLNDPKAEPELVSLIPLAKVK